MMRFDTPIRSSANRPANVALMGGGANTLGARVSEETVDDDFGCSPKSLGKRALLLTATRCYPSQDAVAMTVATRPLFVATFRFGSLLTSELLPPCHLLLPIVGLVANVAFCYMGFQGANLLLLVATFCYMLLLAMINEPATNTALLATDC